MPYNKLLKLFLVVCVLIMTDINGTVAAEVERPVVVELFTSQGCSSCPPADKFLKQLAKESNGSDILPLSFHVDYWDYIGWKDPFSNKVYTNRQKLYAYNMKKGKLLTPQMIVDGKYNEIGSRTRHVRKLIRKAKDDAKGVPIDFESNEENEEVVISVGVEGETKRKDGEHDIWMVAYSYLVKTEVGRGENRGRTIYNANVVRAIYKLGSWEGGLKKGKIDLSKLKKIDAVAILVQEKNLGPIKGAAVYKR